MSHSRGIWGSRDAIAGVGPCQRASSPLIGFDGQNYGFIQASDRLEGEFTEQDEANLVRLAILTSAALDGLAQLYLPDYQDKVGT